MQYPEGWNGRWFTWRRLPLANVPMYYVLNLGDIVFVADSCNVDEERFKTQIVEGPFFSFDAAAAFVDRYTTPTR